MHQLILNYRQRLLSLDCRAFLLKSQAQALSGRALSHNTPGWERFWINRTRLIRSYYALLHIRSQRVPTPRGLKGVRSLVTKSCRTEFRSEKTGNKMVKERMLRIRNMCSVASCFDRNIALLVLNPVERLTNFHAS